MSNIFFVYMIYLANQSIQNSMCAFWHANNLFRDAGTEGAGGAAAPVALHQEEQGGQLKVPFQFKGCLGEIANCQKCQCNSFTNLLQFKMQEMQSSSFKSSTIAWRRTPSHPYDPINRKHD